MKREREKGKWQRLPLVAVVISLFIRSKRSARKGGVKAATVEQTNKQTKAQHKKKRKMLYARSDDVAFTEGRREASGEGENPFRLP